MKCNQLKQLTMKKEKGGKKGEKRGREEGKKEGAKSSTPLVAMEV